MYVLNDYQKSGKYLMALEDKLILAREHDASIMKLSRRQIDKLSNEVAKIWNEAVLNESHEIMIANGKYIGLMLTDGEQGPLLKMRFVTKFKEFKKNDYIRMSREGSRQFYALLQDMKRVHH